MQFSVKTKVFCVVMTKSVSHSYNLAMAIQIFYGQRNFVVHSICSLNLLHRSQGLSIYVQQRQLVWAQYAQNYDRFCLKQNRFCIKHDLCHDKICLTFIQFSNGHTNFLWTTQFCSTLYMLIKFTA